MLSNVQQKHISICIKEGFTSLNELQKATNYSKSDIQDFLIQKDIIKSDNNSRELNS